MNTKEKLTSFSCTPYSFEQISPLISKGRVRLFYLGLNRNGGFITKEYAEQKLLPSLPGAPIIGHYEEEEGDFTSHMTDRNIRRAYGFVPTEANIDWEKHLDSDGIERTYVCCDIFLWTGRFDAAKEIIGKPHSLELMPESIKGSWKKVEGYKEGFVYTDGVFLGLSVLGEKVEPCFEGAAFYELLTQFNLFMQTKYTKIGGIKEMINYRLKNDEKYAKLFSALNPNFTEEGKWEYEKEIVNYSDNSILSFNPIENTYSLIPYSKNEQEQIIFESEMPAVVQAYSVDNFSKWEEFTQKLEDNSFEGIISSYNTMQEELSMKSTNLEEKTETVESLDKTVKTLKREKEELESKKVELEEMIATSKTEKENLERTNASLMKELEDFKTEKNAFELKQKQEKLYSFKDFISEQDYQNISNELNNFSMLDLEKELAYFSIKRKPELLNNHFVPAGNYVDSDSSNALESVLNKYSLKLNK